jgi:hypothetical protein
MAIKTDLFAVFIIDIETNARLFAGICKHLTQPDKQYCVYIRIKIPGFYG